MKQVLAAAAALAFSATTLLAQAGFGPLIDPATLESAQSSEEDLLVLDIRANKDGYAEGHIEGSVNAPYGLFRGPENNPGQLVSEATLTDVLSNAGATPDRPTVIVYQGTDVTDFGAAARVYWTLKSSGVSQLAILNGGVNAWTEAGKILTKETSEPAPSEFEVSFSDQWLATVDDVQAVLNGDDDALLLDARPESFWNGEQAHPAAARPGTLPQSEYFEHAGWFSGGPAIIDAAAARALSEEQGFTSADQLISFCNTGHWAATNWFALSELAGIENVKLFPESMVGWSNAGYEMANVPGPIRYLWIQIKNIF
ncbi:thiosulfate/3-mercaptopyruvate sulfurtransferase [Poseidonocella pacifica]|uniref:Thiosulfate/3-mercaptopyruvate sulfurtransferase n=1 Tax=Poseidonocella pacifica TaxID=871651 RepID=A0A1I0XUJ1_9RHOB|nr:rhodanese-like domain-containing protein [Poseidonocella pacifica]SFB04327.1 thiosulfate/3-mercaptopyruvate sulfurtransferase [Poseidonocella pacifica]